MMSMCRVFSCVVGRGCLPCRRYVEVIKECLSVCLKLECMDFVLSIYSSYFHVLGAVIDPDDTSTII